MTKKHIITAMKKEELNSQRKENILNLLKKCHQTDKHYEQFASKNHKYKLNPPIDKNKVIELEKQYGFKLPEEYFWFITEVGNGGACHGYGMDKFEDINLDYIKYDNKINKMKEYCQKVSEGYEIDQDSKNEVTNYGILKFGTLGYSYIIGLIVTGENKGKVIYYDRDFNEEPSITCDDNFVNYYENWLLETSLDYKMGTFGIRLRFEIDDLIKYYNDILNNKEIKDSRINKRSIITTIFKYKSLDEKHLNEIYNLYNLEKDENYKLQLVIILDNHKYKNIEKNIRDAFRNNDIIDLYISRLFFKVYTGYDLYSKHFKYEIINWIDEIKLALDYYKELMLHKDIDKDNNFAYVLNMAIHLYKNNLIDFDEFKVFIDKRNKSTLYHLSFLDLEFDHMYDIYLEEFINACKNRDEDKIRNTTVYLENILKNKNNNKYKKSIVSCITNEYNKLLEYYESTDSKNEHIFDFIKNGLERIFQY